MSSMVRIPAAMARSPQRRSAVQNALRHAAPQNRCGLPPRRGRNGLSHHWQIVEVPSVMTRPSATRRRDQLAGECSDADRRECHGCDGAGVAIKRQPNFDTIVGHHRGALRQRRS
jgi:hypothetical protein